MATTRETITETHAVEGVVHELNVVLHRPLGGDAHVHITQSVEFLEEHLRRLFKIEQNSGLLEIIVAIHPELTHEAHRIEAERDAILSEAHRLVLALEDRHSPSDHSLHALMKELRRLIANILQHEHHELRILIDSVNIDSGGES